MKKFLVGVDGSDLSLRALRKAGEYAFGVKAQLVLAYALAPVSHLSEVYTGQLAELEASDRKNGEVILRDAARVARESGCEVSVVMLNGSPAVALAERAEHDKDIDLVVVGSRGLGAMASAILGSVTDKLVRDCKKPVLVVH
ncbi:nucleotide-binding universal stress UspA family protein [Archangium gephyra]|uniref:Nucleotide-binding universal stress UspA family protein n=1 Tax=Archangium gephyra TaxID=48 RepID=A0AAC8TJA7_9BACT|nr:universal stress protein [Archangium gephyra]AKJ07710.1 Universal stress protein UspA [Archangium gephyra]REG29464.1 nucleotide-binding universal stress UspA family protein [Archangium gephyra]